MDPPMVTHPTLPSLQCPLTALLSHLPPELRLQIYAHAVPFLHHQGRRKILLAYLPDAAWMAISEPVFHDAAPSIFSSRPLYIYTRLQPKPHANLLETFESAIHAAYPADCEWTMPIAKSLARRLGLTIRYPEPDFEHLPERLEKHLERLEEGGLTGLEELVVSLGVEWMPFDLLSGEAKAKRILKDRAGMEEEVRRFVEGEGETPMMVQVVRLLRRHVPASCRVLWKFDRAGMPDTSPPGKMKEARIMLEKFNEAMGWLWEYLASSDIAVDDTVAGQKEKEGHANRGST